MLYCTLILHVGFDTFDFAFDLGLGVACLTLLVFPLLVGLLAG